jgi:hypothetical protein
MMNPTLFVKEWSYLYFKYIFGLATCGVIVHMAEIVNLESKPGFLIFLQILFVQKWHLQSSRGFRGQNKGDLSFRLKYLQRIWTNWTCNNSEM